MKEINAEKSFTVYPNTFLVYLNTYAETIIIEAPDKMSGQIKSSLTLEITIHYELHTYELRSLLFPEGGWS